MTISVRPEQLKHTTGVSQANASAATCPNDSTNEGTITQSALEYSLAN